METRGAVDTDLGILKTGKEADVFLVERADPYDPDGGVVMAAKRYRDTDHRTFHRAATYAEGRSVKRSRDERALKRKSTWGRSSRPASGRSPSGTRSSDCGRSGAAVPYPVQIDGHRDPDGVDHPSTARRRRGWPRPGPSRRCWRCTTSRSATSSR